VTWDGSTAEWWRAEVAGDRSYERDVDGLLFDVAEGFDGRWLDVGCGDGRLLESTRAVGVDSSRDLVRRTTRPVAVARAEDLPFAPNVFDGAYVVLVLEHIGDVEGFFGEVGRVVRPGGTLAAVFNHPVYTAPGSGPFVDPEDGEVLWRWGAYLAPGSSWEPAGEGALEFRHRPLGMLLTAAAGCGWMLERALERSLQPDRDPLLAVQREVPRLLGVRWRRVRAPAAPRPRS